MIFPAQFSTQMDFTDARVEKWSGLFRSKGSAFWKRTGEAKALDLFHRAATQIPAYRDFLKKHKVNHRKVETIKDFKRVPAIDKKNYLRAYPLRDLLFPEQIQRLHTLSASSGSTGTPFFWPRGETQEMEGAFIHELIFREFFGITPAMPVLCIVAFSMGTWIAGTYTLASVKAVSNKGYRILSIAPGIDKQTLLEVLGYLLPDFKTVIIAGYPPYVKDILDEGEERGIRWRRYDMKFLVAGESISEPLRDYLVKKGGAQSPLRDVISLYGTADAAILAHETPLSIFIRKRVSKDRVARNALFGDGRLPSFLQYYPAMKFFESEGNNLIFSSASGIPLVRYRIGDIGGIFSFEEFIQRSGDFSKEILREFPLKRFLWRLPFVYLFGRADLTASIYSVLIYPETIKSALEARAFHSFITGKFTVKTKHRRNHDQYFAVHIELRSGCRATEKFRKKIEHEILNALLRNNMEYRKLYQSLGRKVLPVVTLVPHADPRYFSSGNKQRWVHCL